MKTQRRTHILYISIALLLAVVLAISAVLFSALIRYDQGNQKSGQLHSIEIRGEYSEEGGSWKPLTRQTHFGNLELRDITVRGHFTRDLPQGSNLFLNIDHMRVSLRINGEELFRLKPMEGDGNPTQAMGKQWVTVISPGISTEDVVELNFGNLYWNAYMIQFDELLWHMHTGDDHKMFFEAVHEDRWTLGIGAVFLFLTLFLLIASLCCAVLKNQSALQFLWLGLATLFSSLWFLTLSPAPTLILPWPVFLNVLYAFSMQGIAIFVVLFVAGNVSGSRRRILLICEIVLLLTLLVGLINQLLSIQDLYSAINYLSIFDLAAAICIIFCLSYEAIRMKRKTAFALLKAMLPLAVCAVVELINGYLQFFVAAVLLGIGLIWFIVAQGVYILTRIKKSMENEKRMLQLENELNENRIAIMLSQIQPHFLYNALNTIQYLCRTQPEKAAEIVADFSDYLRGNMDSLIRKSSIPFEQELRHLKNYLNIEQVRFPKINIEYDLQTSDFFLPAMSLQPLVENAIRHGVTQREEGGTVRITAWEDNGAWYLQVKDDGVGFDPTLPKQDGRSHIGLANTKERLSSMCNGTLEIESTLDVGTCITMKIPKEDTL